MDENNQQQNSLKSLRKRYGDTLAVAVRTLTVIAGIKGAGVNVPLRVGRLAAMTLESLGAEMHADAQHYGKVARRTQRALKALREEFAGYMLKPTSWEAEIADLNAAITQHERALLSLTEHRAWLERKAAETLKDFPQRTRKVRRFNALAQHLALEYVAETGRTATVITVNRESSRGGPFVDFVHEHLCRHAREEGIQWPMSRSALAERLHRALYDTAADVR